MLAKLWSVDFILRAIQKIKKQLVLINKSIIIIYQEDTRVEKNEQIPKMEIQNYSEGCTTL